jgi:leader peptidase (prepilin peptidase)/N-methyltransferase
MDLYIRFFTEHPPLFNAFSMLLGLLTGSFLNVVIYRLPIMMERRELDVPQGDTFNLSKPASACPSCKHHIRWWENVPVLSYLVLWGKCSGCGDHISCRYPLIELFTGALFLTIALVWGVTLPACLFMLGTALLVAMMFIDWDTRYLPNELTLLFFIVAVVTVLTTDTMSLKNALWGLGLGVFPLYITAVLMQLFRGKEVIGVGDLKLLAGLGVMLGAEGVLNTLLLASVLFIVGHMLNANGEKEDGRLSAFGPHIIIAGWMQMVWGSSIYRLGLFDLSLIL